MCHPIGSRPPSPPADLLPISGGAQGESVVLTSEDATRFRGYLARTQAGEAGVVIAPDVRGLHPFYEELAERFAEAGVNAIALDYFGRTAGVEPRGEDFDFRPHVAKTTSAGIQADIAAAAGHLRGGTDTQRLFVAGFCMGGRAAFNASAEQEELAGVIGFYGRLNRREGETGATPAENAARMRAPVLGLFGGADAGIPKADIDAFRTALEENHVSHHVEVYPGAPHSFFDKSASQNQEACDDAWRRTLAFIKTKDPAAR